MQLPHRLQGQKVKSQGHGAGAYCGGHLAAQLVIIIIINSNRHITIRLCLFSSQITDAICRSPPVYLVRDHVMYDVIALPVADTAAVVGRDFWRFDDVTRSSRRRTVVESCRRG